MTELMSLNGAINYLKEKLPDKNSFINESYIKDLCKSYELYPFFPFSGYVTITQIWETNYYTYLPPEEQAQIPKILVEKQWAKAYFPAIIPFGTKIFNLFLSSDEQIKFSSNKNKDIPDFYNFIKYITFVDHQYLNIAKKYIEKIGYRWDCIWIACTWDTDENGEVIIRRNDLRFSKKDLDEIIREKKDKDEKGVTSQNETATVAKTQDINNVYKEIIYLQLIAIIIDILMNVEYWQECKIKDFYKKRENEKLYELFNVIFQSFDEIGCIPENNKDNTTLIDKTKDFNEQIKISVNEYLKSNVIDENLVKTFLMQIKNVMGDNKEKNHFMSLYLLCCLLKGNKKYINQKAIIGAISNYSIKGQGDRSLENKFSLANKVLPPKN